MSCRNSLSVLIITHNEGEVLSDCLASVSWVDEIIILDFNSQDKTRHIAAQYGAKIFQSTNWLGFGVQRQRVQTYANSDYILMLDADERVTYELRQSIEKILQRPDYNVVYSCTRYNLFFDTFIRHGSWYPDKVIRLYARKYYNYNTLLVHESLDIGNTKVINLKGNLLHLACRDLMMFQHKQLKYAEDWAKIYYKQGYKCNMLIVIIHTYYSFIRNWLFRFGFLDGKYGWLLAMINAQYTFNKYTALWVLNNFPKKDD